MNGFLRTLLSLMLIVITGVAVFVGGFIAGRYTLASPTELVSGLAAIAGSGPPEAGTPPDLEATFAPFWEAWKLVHDEYVDQPLDDTALMQGAISGMVAALGDKHSSYMSPNEYQIINTDQSGELEGIGANVEGAEGGGLRVVSPFPGSPAEAAGLLPGDLIVKVDDTDVLTMDEFAIINLVRGPAGSTVRLTILRGAATEPQEFTVRRAKIIIPSVEGKLLDSGLAYVKINDFGQRTTGELKDTLRSLMDQNPPGLILDLRGNPGGYLDTAIEVISQFVPRGTLVMREQFGDGREVEYEARGGGLATDIPLVVLIDQGSASASEIVAGAVQDLARGTLVGATSYGKGSVQNWTELGGDNGAVRVTVARWYTPDGRTINEQGITPEVGVELTEDDRAAGRDPQLDEAVRQLTQPTGGTLPARSLAQPAQ